MSNHHFEQSERGSNRAGWFPRGLYFRRRDSWRICCNAGQNPKLFSLPVQVPTSTNSTRLCSNTSEGKAEALRSLELWSRWTVASNEARLRNLQGFPSILPNESKRMPTVVVHDSLRPIFFSGDDSLEYGNDRMPRGRRYLPAKQMLDVVDSTDGFYLKGVCTLIPRQEALSTYKKRQTWFSFNAFMRMAVAGKSNSCVSSTNRAALISDSGSGKYVSKGVYAARNRRGLAIHPISEVQNDRI